MAAIFHILLIVAVIFDGSVAPNVQLLENVAAKFQYTNTALGTFSRSKTVNAVSRQMRGDDVESVQESLNQAIVTLAVLDIGGGALVPLTSKIIDTLTTDHVFADVANAMIEYGDTMVESLDDLGNLNDRELKAVLSSKRKTAIRLFETKVNGLEPTHRALKHIRKAQKWLGVRSAGKVLGPLFDMVSIGVNGWALGTAIRDCVEDAEACNPASITAASLSIASGLVGVGTFIASLMVSGTSVLGPVGAIVGFTLAITATLIELFWRPGPTQAELDRLMKERLMRELDRISRLQLYNANKFLAENLVERSDLYVVNQGHLPKWFPQHPSVLKFGEIAANKPRRKIPLRQQCSNPVFGNAPLPRQPYSGWAPYQCPYLVDGEMLRTTRTNEDLGYGFYGFTETARTYFQGKSQGRIPPDRPYAGTILLVGTDQVQPHKLAEYENMQANLKGLNIDTATKNGADGDFDDLIAIADMHSMDARERITVRMGSGNDALNIDGRIGSFSVSNILDADLGTSGHNTLSFDAIAADSPIKGIEFNAIDGALHFKHGTNERQRVGTVRNVEILAASPFNDLIKMYAGKSGEGEFDFTVFKFKGHASYEINIVDLASQAEKRDFKIVDSTDNGRDCAGHIPLLKLINFGMDAVANDIQYKNDRIMVYGTRAASRTRSHFKKLLAAAAVKKKSDKRTIHCSGEPTDGSHPEGGRNGKVLLATIAFYSKCPIEIKTTNVQGTCMMSPRKKFELDLAFFEGKKLFADFSGNVTAGIQSDDHCYLQCPSARVTEETWIRLNSGTRDKVIISSELFLDPCGVDGWNVRMPLMQANRDLWMFKITGNDDKFSDQNLLLQGVEQIINEYGDLVIDLNNPSRVEYEIYEEYSRVTMDRIATIAGHERTNEVKNSLLQCMKDASEMSVEEQEICLS